MSDVHGKIWWSELVTNDADRAMDFYEATLGWKWDDLAVQGSDQRYFMALRNGRPIAGLMPGEWLVDMPENTMQWVNYFAVEDVADAVAQGIRQGAAVLRAAIEVPDVGRIALMQDNVGAIIGFIAPSRT